MVAWNSVGNARSTRWPTLDYLLPPRTHSTTTTTESNLSGINSVLGTAMRKRVSTGVNGRLEYWSDSRRPFFLNKRRQIIG
jgi:hypothetical protein